jgi:hypothetical protein
LLLVLRPRYRSGSGLPWVSAAKIDGFSVPGFGRPFLNCAN